MVKEINGNGGAALHRKLIDMVLVPLIVASLMWIGRTVMTSQSKLIEIEQRLQNIEIRTSVIPPADYRTYLEAKFAETNRRLDELAHTLEDHRAETR